MPPHICRESAGLLFSDADSIRVQATKGSMIAEGSIITSGKASSSAFNVRLPFSLVVTAIKFKWPTTQNKKSDLNLANMRGDFGLGVKRKDSQARI